MSKEIKKEKTTPAPEPVAAPEVKPTPLEEATAKAAKLLPKLYAAMDENDDLIYTGPEVAEAIGLDPENPIHVQGCALAWHKMFDEGKVPSPSMTKPKAKPKRGGKRLPSVV